MDIGGAETWLMHLLRHVERERFPMDFLVHTSVKGAYDEEINELGGQIHTAPMPSRVYSYETFLRSLFRAKMRYTAVHAHRHLGRGHLLRVAAQEGVPVRIAHSHTTRFPTACGLLQRLYKCVTDQWIAKYATHGLACSREAAAALFGDLWHHNPRVSVMPCGLDFSKFYEPNSAEVIRSELGISEDKFVIGHVGRFEAVKNHRFLLDIAKCVLARHNKAHFLLVGDGKLRPEMEQLVEFLGLSDCFTFAGKRIDIARLMLGAMDAFVFPSLYEGLGLVLIEAQAAGLPCVISEVVTDETTLVPRLIRRMPLSRTQDDWAQALLAAKTSLKAIHRQKCLEQVISSPFNLHSSIRDLELVYMSRAMHTQTKLETRFEQ